MYHSCIICQINCTSAGTKIIRLQQFETLNCQYCQIRYAKIIKILATSLSKSICMISTLSGTIMAYQPGLVVLQTNNIGFSINTPTTITCTLNNQITLQTYMHWSQEQGPTLYGFQTELDKQVFLLIIGCSGIGPKLALAALSHMSAASFIRAVQQADCSALSSVSGIGEKKAEQIIVQLKHKVEKLLKSGVIIEEHQEISDIHNVTQVLTSLNYSRTEISSALGWLQEQNKGATVAFDKLVRQALSFLAKKA